MTLATPSLLPLYHTLIQFPTHTLSLLFCSPNTLTTHPLPYQFFSRCFTILHNIFDLRLFLPSFCKTPALYQSLKLLLPQGFSNWPLLAKHLKIASKIVLESYSPNGLDHFSVHTCTTCSTIQLQITQNNNMHTYTYKTNNYSLCYRTSLSSTQK